MAPPNDAMTSGRSVSKFDLALIVIAVVGGALWIEHGHRIVIDAPTRSEPAASQPACPDNDNVPYSASCIKFLGHVSGMNWQANAAESVVAPQVRAPRQ
jgi:hypothetical protein